jgi:hypothetical protein
VALYGVVDLINQWHDGHAPSLDYNAAFSEIKNAVQQNENLDPLDNSQLAKAIQRAGSSFYYKDIGTLNAVTLERFAAQRDNRLYIVLS